MTTLQKGICLGCVLIAGGAAVTTALLISPDQAPASEQAHGQATGQNADAPAPPASTPAPTPGAARTQQPKPSPAKADPAPKPGTTLPPVEVEPEVFDFGLKNPDNLVWTQFKLVNPSSQTLFVRQVKPACKCTVPTLDSKVIPPGGTITIDASIDLRGTIGDVKKSFHVFFEGYSLPVECSIVGKLSYPVQVTPERPRYASAASPTGQLTLRSLEGRPFRVCAVNGVEPTVTFKNSPNERATEWRIQYEIQMESPQTEARDLPYMLLIETDHPGARVLDVKLTGQAVSGREIEWIKLWKQVFVNRNNVNLGVIPKGGHAEFETTVMRPDHSFPCTVSLGSRMFPDVEPGILAVPPDDLAVEIVGIEPVDGRADEETYTVRVTNLSDENRIMQMPLYFHSGEVEARLWIGARLIPSPGDDPCPVE